MDARNGEKEQFSEICMGETCLFCCSKCPECGSTGIRVKYMPVYKMTNDTKNRISMRLMDSYIKLTCDNCGQEFGREDDFEEHDQRLDNLAKAIFDNLGMPTGCNAESITQEDGTHENVVNITHPAK